MHKILIERYKSCYYNWYVPSCRKSNEEPVSFAVYMARAPVSLIKEIEAEMEKTKKENEGKFMESLLEEIKELEDLVQFTRAACAFYYKFGKNPAMMEEMNNELAEMEDLLQDLKEQL